MSSGAVARVFQYLPAGTVSIHAVQAPRGSITRKSVQIFVQGASLRVVELAALRACTTGNTKSNPAHCCQALTYRVTFPPTHHHPTRPRPRYGSWRRPTSTAACAIPPSSGAWAA